MNGVVNFSVLDGWWDEGYVEPEVNGWAIGGREQNPDDGAQDWADSQDLYRILEQEIVPCYYDRGPDGIPKGWLTMMRASMASTVWRFSATRMLEEYVEQLYLNAAREESSEGLAGTATADRGSWRPSRDSAVAGGPRPVPTGGATIAGSGPGLRSRNHIADHAVVAALPIGEPRRHASAPLSEDQHERRLSGQVEFKRTVARTELMASAFRPAGQRELHPVPSTADAGTTSRSAASPGLRATIA